MARSYTTNVRIVQRGDLLDTKGFGAAENCVPARHVVIERTPRSQGVAMADRTPRGRTPLERYRNWQAMSARQRVERSQRPQRPRRAPMSSPASLLPLRSEPTSDALGLRRPGFGRVGEVIMNQRRVVANLRYRIEYLGGTPLDEVKGDHWDVISQTVDYINALEQQLEALERRRRR